MNDIIPTLLFILIGLAVGIPIGWKISDAGWKFWHRVAIGELTRKEQGNEVSSKDQ